MSGKKLYVPFFAAITILILLFNICPGFAGEAEAAVQQSNDWANRKIHSGVLGLVKQLNRMVTERLSAIQSTENEAVDLINSVIVVKGNIVNVREGAGTEFRVVTQVKAGDRLKALKKSGKWYQAQLTDGKKGWVAEWLVEVVKSNIMSRNDTEPETNISPDPGEGQDSLLPPAKIQSIEFSENGSGEEQLVIKSEGDIKYKVSVLKQPDRLVIDLQNSDLNNNKDLNTGQALVNKVRVAQYSLDPMVVRIVLDLNRTVSYTSYIDEDGKSLIFNLSEPSIKKKIIVVDPGHGGYDPGAIGVTGLYEKDFNLDLAIKLRDKLTALGATVIMTRTDDSFISLASRAAIANQAYANIFISIHANASTSPTPKGTSTYFYAPSTNPSLYSQYEQRQNLARSVQDRLVAQLGTRDLGVFQENFAVTRETKMPSILVETAFLSNKEDEALLKDNEFRNRAAQAIADGLCDYFANS